MQLKKPGQEQTFDGHGRRVCRELKVLGLVANGEKPDLVLASIEQVADNKLVAVLYQGLVGLGRKKLGIRLELEGDYKCIRRPLGNQGLEELGHLGEGDVQFALGRLDLVLGLSNC